MVATGGAPAGGRLILSAADTPVERELVARWVAESDEAEVVGLRDRDLADRLRAGDDPLLVPVRVSWLPRERDGRREAGWRDLLRLRDPRRPPRFVQGRIADREADRYRLVVGEPAPLSQLRRRFVERGGVPDSPALATFVVRQATLALERAERAVIGERYKVPRLVVDEIVAAPRHRQAVADLAARLDRSPAEVGAQVASALRHLVAVQSRLAVDIFGTAMRPLHARAWSVRARAAELERLRELNRRSALVFLPSHRSYADTLVLAEALHAHDFPRNHVVAGDNLALWPFAPLARRAGLVFIRRTFGGDDVYKLAVQEYFGYLLAKRFNLEWYFEGGRSRTGKLRPPRLGLLTYVAAALRADPGINVHLVPVSITYGHLHEVTAMAAEQQGAPKRREGLGWLAGYARGQRRPAGDAVVRFGEPIEMRPRLAPGSQPMGDDGSRLAISKLAFEVAVGINRVTPVLPASLLTLALLGVGDRALTLGEVAAVVDPLLDYIDARSLPERGTAALRDPAGLAAELHALERTGLLSAYTGGAEPVWSVVPGKHLVAAFYRNMSVHWFVNRAVAELSVLAAADSGGGAPAVAEAGLRLRDLLKHEFFFSDKVTFAGELAAELDLVDPDRALRVASVPQARELLGGTDLRCAHRVLRAFVEAELVVAERLAAQPVGVEVEQKAFLVACTGVGRQMLLQGRVHSAEALSVELFRSALRLAGGRDLLGPGTESDLGERRAAFAEEVRQVAARIELVAAIDATA